MRLGGHVRDVPHAFVGVVGASWGKFPRMKSENAKGCAVVRIHARNNWVCPEVRLALFSRSFIRKRAISFATTASVAVVSLVMAQEPTSAHRSHAATPIQYVADRTDNSGEASFLSENESAMSKMMIDMMVKPAGDIDRDFVAMMIPHHQGAVDMAKAELKYGHNELLRRLSKEIIANQQREITVMRLAVDDERPLPSGSPGQPAAASSAPRMSQEPMPHEMMPHETMGMSHDAKPRD
jgi:Domain of unknown function (DUF305)